MVQHHHPVSISLHDDLEADIDYLIETTPHIAKNKSQLLEKIIRSNIPRRN